MNHRPCMTRRRFPPAHRSQMGIRSPRRLCRLNRRRKSLVRRLAAREIGRRLTLTSSIPARKPAPACLASRLEPDVDGEIKTSPLQLFGILDHCSVDLDVLKQDRTDALPPEQAGLCRLIESTVLENKVRQGIFATVDIDMPAVILEPAVDIRAVINNCECTHQKQNATDYTDFTELFNSRQICGNPCNLWRFYIFVAHSHLFISARINRKSSKGAFLLSLEPEEYPRPTKYAGVN